MPGIEKGGRRGSAAAPFDFVAGMQAARLRRAAIMP